MFRYAVATGRASADPTAALRGAIASPVVTHRAAIVDPKAFGGLLRATTTYEGAPETRIALEVLALTFVRPGELRAAEWSEIDLDAAVWSIPAAKMKMRRPHRVPLAPQAVSAWHDLRETRHACAGHPANRSRRLPAPQRTFMGRDFGNYDSVMYELYDANTGQITHPRFNLKRMIDLYSVEAEAALRNVLSVMKARWP